MLFRRSDDPLLPIGDAPGINGSCMYGGKDSSYQCHYANATVAWSQHCSAAEIATCVSGKSHKHKPDPAAALPGPMATGMQNIPPHVLCMMGRDYCSGGSSGLNGSFNVAGYVIPLDLMGLLMR